VRRHGDSGLGREEGGGEGRRRRRRRRKRTVTPALSMCPMMIAHPRNPPPEDSRIPRGIRPLAFINKNIKASSRGPLAYESQLALVEDPSNRSLAGCYIRPYSGTSCPPPLEKGEKQGGGRGKGDSGDSRARVGKLASMGLTTRREEIDRAGA